MKKLLSLMLTILMLIYLSACADDDVTGGDVKIEKGGNEDKVTVFLDLDFGDNNDTDETESPHSETAKHENVTEKKEEISNPSEDKDARTYLICTECIFEPFAFSYEEGKYTGFDWDIMNETAKYGAFSVYLRDEGFDEGLQALANGDYSGMISAVTKTAERAPIYDFSDSYFTDGIAVIVAKDSNISDLYDLRDKKVGVVKDTEAEYTASYESDEYGYDIVTYEDYSPMYDALKKGTVDAVIEEFSFAAWRILNMDYEMTILPELLWEVKYYFIVPKGENKELLDSFNRGLEEIRENGVYDEILSRYGFDNIAE